MKIGILTQALHGNYGGLLQNYALQQVLINMGHQPITIDRHIPRNESIVKNLAKATIRILKSHYSNGYLSSKQRAYLAKHQLRFIKDHIYKTKQLHTQADFDKEVTSGVYNAFIVGSDQCWRPCYSANIFNYFLDFAQKRNIKKIAYAASFGVDKWEYTPEQTLVVSNLAKCFNNVSVREKSAVSLCKHNLGIDSEWVLDPTMLFGAEGFKRFITENNDSGITTYLLEDSQESRTLVHNVGKILNITQIIDNISSSVFHRFDSLKKHINISVEEWLSNIANARFVITDSFHGAVFSILFNVPFIVKLNGVRGNTRLESLLTDFGLEECICDDINSITIPNIDWHQVNKHLESRRRQSKDFLIKALQ